MTTAFEFRLHKKQKNIFFVRLITIETNNMLWFVNLSTALKVTYLIYLQKSVTKTIYI